MWKSFCRSCLLCFFLAWWSGVWRKEQILDYQYYTVVVVVDVLQVVELTFWETNSLFYCTSIEKIFCCVLHMWDVCENDRTQFPFSEFTSENWFRCHRSKNTHPFIVFQPVILPCHTLRTEKQRQSHDCVEIMPRKYLSRFLKCSTKIHDVVHRQI